MKRKLTLLVCLIVLVSCFAVIAIEYEGTTEESVCATGSLEMDSEQLTSFLNEIPMIVNVKPNQLYIERLNEESSAKNEVMSRNGTNWVKDGEEIITNHDTDSGLLSTDEISYPSKVDNSAEKTFPVIKDQGNINSCLGWSLAFYQLTNNANKLRGTTARSGTSNISSRVYSPNWVYNLGNKGDNSGTYSEYALSVLYTYGCPSIQQVPIKISTSSAANYLSWYPTASIWENALYNKCDLYYGTVNPDNLDTPVTSSQSPYLDNLKRLLADGYVVTIETYVNTDKDNYLPVTKTGRTSTASSAYVWTEVKDNNTVTGHAVTIVGYDDNFKVDINGNGSYQTGEYGAFKIANSWGTDEYNHNNGYVWLSYDALNAVSSVKSSVHSERVPAFRNGDIYYFIKPQKEYKPLLTANVGIKTDSRNNIRITLGIENTNDTSEYFEKKISKTSYFDNTENENTMTERIAFWRGYGQYNLSGTSGSSVGHVVFDLTALLSEFEMNNNENYSLYIELEDYSDEDEITIESVSLYDHYNDEIYECLNLPISTDINNNIIKANIFYPSSITTSKPDKTFNLTFNSKVDSTTVNNSNITLINSNEDNLDINLSLSEDEETIMLNKQSGDFTNDFYTINISPNLRSKGGNNLSEAVNHPFYVPFH